MRVCKATKDLWDEMQKEEAAIYCINVAQMVSKYMISAVEYANGKTNISSQAFWENLFEPRKNNAQLSYVFRDGEGKRFKRVCPAKPYQELDLQAVLKYLKYGDGHRGPDYSRSFFQVFDISDVRGYKELLNKAINFRNQYLGHLSGNAIKTLDREKFQEIINTYKKLTQVLKNCRECIPAGMEPIEEAWKKIDEELEELNGSIEIRSSMDAERSVTAASTCMSWPIKAAALLRQRALAIKLEPGMIDLYLEYFVPLLDESVFLYEDGRKLIAQLQSILAKRKEKLLLDESVIQAIFRQLRSNAPTEDTAEPDALKRERQTLYEEAKNAVKVLRLLKGKGCMEILSAATASEHSGENLRSIIQTHPDTRFLLLTADKQLAEEIAHVEKQNAVAAKPTFAAEPRLFLFYTTYDIYCSMLDAAAKPDAQADPSPSRVEASPYVLPEAGEQVTIQYPNGTSQSIRLTERLGDGGEGIVYATEDPRYAVKLYFPENLTEVRLEKLDRMVRRDPHIPGLCWPSGTISDQNGRRLGFLMPRAMGKELAHTVFYPGRDNRNILEQGWSRKDLVQIACNISRVFSQMHERGILMGDVNPRNFMATKDCGVFFVDCDSYQFEDFACPVGTPLFTPPEIHRDHFRKGIQEYSYIRTEENECYAIATLLFEILMLGKGPYESRNSNNDDIVQAIINGDFPYPYHADDEDTRAASSNIQPPVGKWRMIWSHMPYQVKTKFYAVFKGKERPSAREWQTIMERYVRLIEEGKSTDEILPNTFKVVKSMGIDDATTNMVDLLCSDCGQPFNMGQDVYERRRARREPVLCDKCREIRRNLEKRQISVTCSRCGATYQEQVMNLEHNAEGPLCPKCRQKRAGFWR